MAKMVTRTMLTDTLTCTVYNTDTKLVQEAKVEAPHRLYKTDGSKANVVKKLIPENLKLIEVVDITTAEQTVGMPVEDFLKYAVPVERPESQRKH